MQFIATVLNGSQDLSEVFNFSTEEKKKQFKNKPEIQEKIAGKTSLISGTEAQTDQIRWKGKGWQYWGPSLSVTVCGLLDLIIHQ